MLRSLLLASTIFSSYSAFCSSQLIEEVINLKNAPPPLANSCFIDQDMQETINLAYGNDKHYRALLTKFKNIEDPNQQLALASKIVETLSYNITDPYSSKKAIVDISEAMIWTHKDEQTLFPFLKNTFNILPNKFSIMSVLDLFLKRFQKDFYWRDPVTHKEQYLRKDTASVIGAGIKFLAPEEWKEFLNIFLNYATKAYQEKHFNPSISSKKVQREKWHFFKIYHHWLKKSNNWNAFVTKYQDSLTAPYSHESIFKDITKIYKVMLDHQLIEKVEQDYVRKRAMSQEDFLKHFFIDGFGLSY